jgi:hypothetical protein
MLEKPKDKFSSINTIILNFIEFVAKADNNKTKLCATCLSSMLGLAEVEVQGVVLPGTHFFHQASASYKLTYSSTQQSGFFTLGSY